MICTNMSTAIDFAALLKAERAARRAKKAASKKIARTLTPASVDLRPEVALGEGKS